MQALSRQELWVEVRHILPYLVGGLVGGAWSLLLVYVTRMIARSQWTKDLTKNYDEQTRGAILSRDKRIKELTGTVETLRERESILLARLKAGHSMAMQTAQTIGVLTPKSPNGSG